MVHKVSQTSQDGQRCYLLIISMDGVQLEVQKRLESLSWTGL